MASPKLDQPELRQKRGTHGSEFDDIPAFQPRVKRRRDWGGRSEIGLATKIGTGRWSKYERHRCLAEIPADQGSGWKHRLGANATKTAHPCVLWPKLGSNSGPWCSCMAQAGKTWPGGPILVLHWPALGEFGSRLVDSGPNGPSLAGVPQVGTLGRSSTEVGGFLCRFRKTRLHSKNLHCPTALDPGAPRAT